MNLEIRCLCGCGYVTKLEGDFPMTLGVEAYYCLNEELNRVYVPKEVKHD